jgi:hypothetical protein
VTTSSPEIDILTTRVTRLTVLASVACVVAVAALFLPLRAADLPVIGGRGIVDASEFSVHDETGKLRGRWTPQGITLVDADGRMRFGINTGASGVPVVTLVSSDGRIRGSLGLGSDDAPGLNLQDHNGRLRARIAVRSDDSPQIVLYGEKGEPVLELPPARVVPSPSRTATPTSDPRRSRKH